jgi:hypothetical protein
MYITATLLEDYQHVCQGDPALDQEAENFQETYARWKETGQKALLDSITKQGETPVVYKLRHLVGVPAWRVQDKVNSNITTDNAHMMETLGYACMLGVVDAENLYDDKGNQLTLQQVTGPDGVRALSAESIYILQQTGAWAELGARVIESMNPSKN